MGFGLSNLALGQHPQSVGARQLGRLAAVWVWPRAWDKRLLHTPQNVKRQLLDWSKNGKTLKRIGLHG